MPCNLKKWIATIHKVDIFLLGCGSCATTILYLPFSGTISTSSPAVWVCHRSTSNDDATGLAT
eukprot:4453265-Amphidinium_carterae.1